MTQTTIAPNQQPHARLDRRGMRRIAQVLVTDALLGAIMFLCAGRLDWWAAWAYLAMAIGGSAIIGLTIGRTNPEVINQRGDTREGQKGWDKVLIAIYGVFSVAVFAVAGLDAGRYGWSDMAAVFRVLGVLGLVVEFWMIWWVMANNAFLSTVVRVQADRGHQVATTGPYRIVRHPMYVALILLWLATPLFLGSWWAMVPAALCIACLVVRTALEDRTLQAELPGYTEYAQQTRYRLLPGLW